jgi:hypothetical protein
VLPRELLEERLREEQHVGAAGAQRTHRELHDVGPGVEVLAKRFLFDACHEVAMGRSHETHVARNLLVTSRGPRGSYLEGPKELGLHLEWHLADLVEKESAPRSAWTKRPLRSQRASVNAPSTWPKSSLSSKLAGIAAQLTVTIGASALRLRR